MIRGHDSGYDSRKCNMHVIINFVYAISGNTPMVLFTFQGAVHLTVIPRITQRNRDILNCSVELYKLFVHLSVSYDRLLYFPVWLTGFSTCTVQMLVIGNNWYSSWYCIIVGTVVGTVVITLPLQYS